MAWIIEHEPRGRNNLPYQGFRVSTGVVRQLNTAKRVDVAILAFALWVAKRQTSA
jgi:hypothetical protein